jgi:hypothetical protein
MRRAAAEVMDVTGIKMHRDALDSRFVNEAISLSSSYVQGYARYRFALV